MHGERGREEEKLPRSSYAKQDTDSSRCRGFRFNTITLQIDDKEASVEEER